jgi:peptidoglycan/xylan/chitin deacetylase (PgdA/CDA1 family)
VSDVLVLCYHAVSEHWPADLAVTPAQLHEQLAGVLARGYRGATFTEAVTERPARKTVAVTFDDGYRSVLELALPVLQALGLQASLFVPTAWVGAAVPMHWPGIDHWAGGEWERELLPLSWDEARALARAGWEIGSHSRTHPRLSALDDAQLAAELTESRRDCERELGRPCTSIAYPYGDVDRRVTSAARRAGYRTGAALSARPNRPRALEWPRVGVSREDSGARFRRQSSPVVRRLMASPFGPPVESAYGAVRRRRRR